MVICATNDSMRRRWKCFWYQLYCDSCSSDFSSSSDFLQGIMWLWCCFYAQSLAVLYSSFSNALLILTDDSPHCPCQSACCVYFSKYLLHHLPSTSRHRWLRFSGHYWIILSGQIICVGRIQNRMWQLLLDKWVSSTSTRCRLVIDGDLWLDAGISSEFPLSQIFLGLN